MEYALKRLGRSLSRAWENLAEGWRELVSRSSDALHIQGEKGAVDQEIARLATALARKQFDSVLAENS